MGFLHLCTLLARGLLPRMHSLNIAFSYTTQTHPIPTCASRSTAPQLKFAAATLAGSGASATVAFATERAGTCICIEVVVVFGARSTPAAQVTCSENRPGCSARLWTCRRRVPTSARSRNSTTHPWGKRALHTCSTCVGIGGDWCCCAPGVRWQVLKLANTTTHPLLLHHHTRMYTQTHTHILPTLIPNYSPTPHSYPTTPQHPILPLHKLQAVGVDCNGQRAEQGCCVDWVKGVAQGEGLPCPVEVGGCYYL